MAARQKYSESIFSKGTKLGVLLVFISLVFVPHTALGFFTMHTWVFIFGVLLVLFSCAGGILYYVSRRRAKKLNSSEVSA